MKTILLFGHRGALGQSIERLFLQRGWSGYGLDTRNVNSGKSTSNPSNTPSFKRMMTVKDIPSFVKIDAVICVAGAFEPNSSEEDHDVQLARMWAANVG